MGRIFIVFVLLSANLFGQAAIGNEKFDQNSTPTPLLPTKTFPSRSGMRES